ncbi:PspC domain-containing protein [Massilia sp. CF038]|uniref:PspC domain-containing protein n=1 Tax=Massilia sp. CF038 TaxID=1881045 RepID=UPI000910133B|nr:PspC domain-containing protein [Massilia sp. CF038]SHG53058.1 phage shock protein C (PspC) family protein [Massilia sp. CF038]
MNISDEIKRLHELHQAGALSAAEFEQAKAKLLNASVNLNKPGQSAASSGNATDDFVNEVSRLRRARGDRWLGGVCGGLGKVSGVESWVWRLVFALCTIFAGFGFLIYLLMWIFVPEE